MRKRADRDRARALARQPRVPSRHLANALDAQRFELFRVPIDGSAPPERIGRTLSAGGDVQTDFVPLTSGRVLYRADQDDDIFELFAFLDQDILRTRRAPSAASPATIVR